MDVNSINGQNSVNNNLGPLSQQSSTGVQSNQAIKGNEKDATNVLINDIDKGNRNAFSYALTSLNEGIATTKITQQALDKQNSDLKQIASRLETIKDDKTSQEEKIQLKDEIQSLLQSFDQTANQTRFNNKSLLNQEDEYINIVTSNASFSIELPNTANISKEIVSAFNNNDITNEFGNEVFATSLSQNSQRLTNASKEIQNIEKNIETVARDAIEEQLQAVNNYASTNDINFGKESADFTKTNVVAQMGYLVSSQANIAQEQSVRLLS